jgi:hypothetical protein
MFARAIFKSEHKSNGPIDTIADLAKAYLEYADGYYRGMDGNLTTEPSSIRYSLKPLIKLHASISLEQFGPLKLAEVRERMILLNWSRNSGRTF